VVRSSGSFIPAPRSTTLFLHSTERALFDTVRHRLVLGIPVSQLLFSASSYLRTLLHFGCKPFWTQPLCVTLFILPVATSHAAPEIHCCCRRVPGVYHLRPFYNSWPVMVQPPVACGTTPVCAVLERSGAHQKRAYTRAWLCAYHCCNHFRSFCFRPSITYL
jgi:hypothetical protein